jgi:phenylpyruvate tautomerase PptA (4-oxalocrotonate tautomerase family)
MFVVIKYGRNKERRRLMDEQQHHEDLIKGITEQMKPVLEKSGQAIYIYLDDTHKVCNKKFADMLGYQSPKEWANTEAPLSDILEEDQDKVIKAYMNASEKIIAGSVEVRTKNIKTGKIVKTVMIVTPIGYGGHVFTAHFFSKI